MRRSSSNAFWGELRESQWGQGHRTDKLTEMALGVHPMVASSASVYSVKIYNEEVEASSWSSSSHACTCPHTPSVKTIGGLDRVGEKSTVDSWEHKGTVM